MLLALWKHECKRVIADRFTIPEEVDWFDQAMAKLAEEVLGDEYKNTVENGVDRYFVDFLRDAPEASGISQSTGCHIWKILERISNVVALLSELQESNVFVLLPLYCKILLQQGKSQKTLTWNCPKCTSLSSQLRV